MRTAALVITVMVLAAIPVGCSDEGEQDRITRIDGPAQVDDDDGDVTPEQSPDE